MIDHLGHKSQITAADERLSQIEVDSGAKMFVFFFSFQKQIGAQPRALDGNEIPQKLRTL
jgi:hypothetical protein